MVPYFNSLKNIDKVLAVTKKKAQYSRQGTKLRGPDSFGARSDLKEN